MEENELIIKAEAEIRSCLGNISFLKIKEIIRKIDRGKVNADLWVKLETPEGYPDLAVEIKNKGELRFIREGVNQLLRYLDYVPNTYGLIIAPYISQKSAQLCKEAGIGFIDFSGNCYLSFKNVYVEKEGKPNTRMEKRFLKSLYYPKAERVLRVLLNNPGQVWKTQNLSKEANVSLGMVSKIKQRLEAVEWINSTSSGFVLMEWEELLKEWQSQYKFTKNKQIDFYSLKNEEEIEKDLSELCNKSNIRFALTMFSGAARIAPYTRYKRVYAYVENEIEQIKNELKLKQVKSGPNLTLLIPYDAGVYYGERKYNDIPAVSPVQIYLDLKSNKGRGEEAADFLMNSVIKNQWSQKQTTGNVK
jgi:hypothetical protein